MHRTVNNWTIWGFILIWYESAPLTRLLSDGTNLKAKLHNFFPELAILNLTSCSCLMWWVSELSDDYVLSSLNRQKCGLTLDVPAHVCSKSMPRLFTTALEWILLAKFSIRTAIIALEHSFASVNKHLTTTCYIGPLKLSQSWMLIGSHKMTIVYAKFDYTHKSSISQEDLIV